MTLLPPSPLSVAVVSLAFAIPIGSGGGGGRQRWTGHDELVEQVKKDCRGCTDRHVTHYYLERTMLVSRDTGVTRRRYVQGLEAREGEVDTATGRLIIKFYIEWSR